MIFQHHQRIVFIGDSITDSGRAGAFAPYGNGYVNLVRNQMLARYPQYNLTFINLGVGGNTIRELAGRWERDVVAQRPDWVCVFIGINDVWRHFMFNPGGPVPLHEYQATLRQLLRRTQLATRARLILMQPYMIEKDPDNPMRRLMDVYGKGMEVVAKEFNAVFVPVQAAFDEVLKHTAPTFWADDRIHPGIPGHTVIALAWLRAIGFAL